jgi:hypothetical protein
MFKPGDRRYNAIVGGALATATFLVVVFFAALMGSSSGEVASAVGSVVGGGLGALGAAGAVYLTLQGQRQEDRSRIQEAIVREVIEFGRLAVGQLDICESIRTGVVKIPTGKLTEVMRMPEPTVYPAVADKIGVLWAPQRVVAFYMRIKEVEVMIRNMAHGPKLQEISTGHDIKVIAESWVFICVLATQIIEDSANDKDFDLRVASNILRQIDNSISDTVANFQIDVELTEDHKEGDPPKSC